LWLVTSPVKDGFCSDAIAAAAADLLVNHKSVLTFVVSPD